MAKDLSKKRMDYIEVENRVREIGSTVEDAARSWVEHKKRLVAKRLGWVAIAAGAFVLGVIVGAVL